MVRVTNAVTMLYSFEGDVLKPLAMWLPCTLATLRLGMQQKLNWHIKSYPGTHVYYISIHNS